jgi:FtsH-binding integral membrane protein
MIALPRDFSPSQLAFIQQSYLIFLMGLSSLLVLGLFSYFVLPQSLRWPLGLIDSLLWIACGFFGLRQPIKVVFPVFILITGLFFGQLARANAGLFITSALLSVLVFAGVTAYVFYSGRDFSFLSSKLGYGFWFLVGGSLLLLFINVSFLSLLLGMVGTAVFIGWLLYDTSQILSRMDGDYSPASGAFDLIMDIVGLRSWVERLIRYFD